MTVHRIEPTPADCVKFHDTIESEFVSAVRELQKERREGLGLVSLRPWDLAVDPLNRPPLKPFAQVEQMVSRTQNIFKHLDPDLAGGFQEMQKLRLLDLANRRLHEADKFEEIFDKQLKLRQQTARNAGFGNYRDYAFRRLGRFDYTPEDFGDSRNSSLRPGSARRRV